MNTKAQKEMASRIMKCGISRIKIKQGKEVEEALTRNDIRELIKKGMIKSEQKKGTSRAHARKLLRQKKRGRRAGQGSRKGTLGARNPAKREWINHVRPLRMLLKELHASGQISNAAYRTMYSRIKGGFFRNRNHLLYFLKENELLGKRKVVSKGGKK